MSENNQTYKADNGKTRLDLVSPTFIEAVGQIRTFGVQKYGDSDSWAKVEPKRYMAALLRHINAYRMGEDIDKESGMSHLWHAACNLMFLIDLDERRKSGDIKLTAETLEMDDEIVEEFVATFPEIIAGFNATFPEVINNITAGVNKIADFLAKYNELSEAQQEGDTPPKENKCCLNCLLFGECKDFQIKTAVNGYCDKWQSDRVEETKAAISALPDIPQEDVAKPKRTCKTCYLYVDEKCQLNGYACLDGYVCKHYAWKGK